ncbi:MAG: SEC-C domain-containing protein, partial [Gammaproteobacteria bacterium]|nr:SEC-C domain-containing protein [Gammaproteobacteria bacterium]
DLSNAIHGLMEDSVGTLLDQHLPRQAAQDDWDLEGLRTAIQRDFNAGVDPASWLKKEPELTAEGLRERVVRAVHEAYDAKVARVGAPIMRHVEKEVMLRKLDQHWREHLAAMDYLRQGIHLRGYAQKDYRFEFKREAFEMFAAMLERIKFETVSLIATIEVRTQEEIEREEEERHRRLMRALQAQHAEASSILAGTAGAAEPAAAPGGAPERRAPGAASGAAAPPPLPAPELQGTFVRSERKVGRNEPCPCGSGKKYKHCHGALSSVE